MMALPREDAGASILLDAADWAERLICSAPTQRTLDAFRYWIDSDPDHYAAFETVNAKLRATGQTTALHLPGNLTDADRPAVAPFNPHALVETLPLSPGSTLKTGIGERRRYQTQDGGTIVLSPLSEADYSRDDVVRTFKLQIGGLALSRPKNSPGNWLCRTENGVVRVEPASRVIVLKTSDSTWVDVVTGSCVVTMRKSDFAVCAGEAARFTLGGGTRLSIDVKNAQRPFEVN